jgi:hypothetical protein
MYSNRPPIGKITKDIDSGHLVDDIVNIISTLILLIFVASTFIIFGTILSHPWTKNGLTIPLGWLFFYMVETFMQLMKTYGVTIILIFVIPIALGLMIIPFPARMTTRYEKKRE